MSSLLVASAGLLALATAAFAFRLVLRVKRQASERVQSLERLRNGLEELEKRVQEQRAELVAVNQKLAEERSERAHIQQALEASEERFRLISEGTNFGILDWDLRTNQVSISPSCEHLLGIDGHRTCANWHSEWKSRLHPDDSLRALEILDSHLTGRSTRYEDEFRIRQEDGSFRWIQARGLAASDGSGSPYRIVCVYVDVTDRHHLEAQFRQSQKMEAIGHLAGGIAHDFNNLLTAIIGYSELTLSKLPQHDPVRKYAEEIRKASVRGSQLTKQLLTFSRKRLDQPVIVNLNQVVANAENLFRRLIGEDIELATNLDPALGQVKADPGQIEQMLMNLVVNARDAMPEGGRLLIETLNGGAEGFPLTVHSSPVPSVILRVSDTGIGMDESVKSRIFEPFFTTKGPDKGTGLGLSTVQAIVRQHGGSITVESEPGKGTTFTIALPLADRAGNPAFPIVPVDGLRGGSETLLLVEDEETVREVIGTTLRAEGYRVLEAQDAAEALHLCERNPSPIHLLLTDVVLRGMNGRRLAERLAALRPGLKVLYMSGYLDDTVRTRGIASADVAFLSKPFNPRELICKVRQILDVERDVPARVLTRTGLAPRILVIDDDEQIREMLRATLEGASFTVTVARNGREGLALAQDRTFDLILTDMDMPELDGLETIQQLRRVEPQPKIVAISGGGQIDPEFYLALAHHLGAVQTLAKPFSPNALLATIRAALGP
ncbi:MAG: response regulator [Nitrospirota bacterium]